MENNNTDSYNNEIVVENSTSNNEIKEGLLDEETIRKRFEKIKDLF